MVVFALVRVIKARADQIAWKDLVPHLVLMRRITPEKANMAINRSICFKENDVSLLSIATIQHLLDRTELVHFATIIACIAIPTPRIDITPATRATSPRTM